MVRKQDVASIDAQSDVVLHCLLPNGDKVSAYMFARDGRLQIQHISIMRRILQHMPESLSIDSLSETELVAIRRSIVTLTAAFALSNESIILEKD